MTAARAGAIGLKEFANGILGHVQLPGDGPRGQSLLSRCLHCLPAGLPGVGSCTVHIVAYRFGITGNFMMETREIVLSATVLADHSFGLDVLPSIRIWIGQQLPLVLNQVSDGQPFSCRSSFPSKEGVATFPLNAGDRVKCYYNLSRGTYMQRPNERTCRPNDWADLVKGRTINAR